MTTEEMAPETTEADATEATDPSQIVAVIEPTKAEIREAERQEKVADLRANESILNKGTKVLRQSLPLMAEALMQIRDRKLYKVAIDPETSKGYKSFDKYLESHEEWGFSRQYASKLINERKDQLAIEAGEEPVKSERRAPKPLTDPEAAEKIWRSWETFTSRVSDYRDNEGTTDAFRKDFDKAFAAADKAWGTFCDKYPMPVVEDTTDAEANAADLAAEGTDAA
jgi:hypothetical protein